MTELLTEDYKGTDVGMLGKGMLEKRAAGRYNLQAHVRLEIVSGSGIPEVFECKTRDISSSGAFLLTGKRGWDVGTALRVNLFFDLLFGEGTWVVMDGKVVRNEAEGIGVRFDGRYQFFSGNSALQM